MDPEKMLRDKFRAKCRFRRLVRMVIANFYWLEENILPYQGDDVQRRVEQALKAKSKRKYASQVLLSIEVSRTVIFISAFFKIWCLISRS